LIERRNAAMRPLESSPAMVPSHIEREAEPDVRRPSAALNYSVILWRRRRSLARITAIGAAVTILLTLLIPNSYNSSTRLMAPEMQGGSGFALIAGLLAKAGGGGGLLNSGLLGGSGNAGGMFVGVLHSRTVADNLVKQFNLKKVYWISKDKDARAKLDDRTEISEDRKSGIITITVTDHSPERSAQLAAAYVDQLNQVLAQVNTSAAHRERVFLEGRLKVVKQELDAASQQLSEYSSKNTTIDPKEQSRAMMQTAVSLQGELIAAQTQLRGLEQIYTDSNVRVRSLRARIAELQSQVAKLRGSDSQQDTGTADNSKEIAPNTDDDLYPSFRKLPGLGVGYADLYRAVKLREIVFETLTQQLEMAKVEEAKEIPSVKILDPADVPEKKSWPPRMLLTLLGAFLTFAAASVFFVGRTVWSQMDAADPRRRFAEEIWNDTQPAYSELQERAQRVGTKFRRNNHNGHYS
jgi:capsule polysaccharide export protein KpsE/RkpR